MVAAGMIEGVKLGMFDANMGHQAQPEGLAAAARAAEEAGFESLWAGEHVVLPDPQVPPSPMAPQDPALDPFIALTYAAAVTDRIRLATGIVIVPQRNPVVLAKQIASLDVLSGGRFTLGIGVGYLEPEFRAIGADYEHRGDGHRRVRRRDGRPLVRRAARVPRPVRRLRRRRRPPATGAAADPGRRRRTHRRRLSPRGRPRPRLVRVRDDAGDRGGVDRRACARRPPRSIDRPSSASWRSRSRPAVG